MLRQLKLDGIKLPEIFIVQTDEDKRVATDSGLPFVSWNGTDEEIIKIVFRPTLEKLFPYIDWNAVLGKRTYRTMVVYVPGGEVEIHPSCEDNDSQAKSNGYDRGIDGTDVADIAKSTRIFSGGGAGIQAKPLDEYVGDLTAEVDLDVLQELELMPKFIGDIMSCIRRNLTSICWTEGYNKKRGVPIGNFNGAKEMRNLIILDVSASIPRGISATMIALIDTLRTKVNADLIVTGGESYFWPIEEQLPSPEKIRNMVTLGNESMMFNEILKTHIAGHEYGNVICFGDNDTPNTCRLIENDQLDMTGTIVHKVWSYHTCSDYYLAGYCKWCEKIGVKREDINMNNDWVNWIKE